MKSAITHHLNIAYDTLNALSWPALLFYYSLRASTDGKYLGNYRYRMGLELPRFSSSSRRVWLHALSVGETLSATTFVKALKEQSPDLEIVFSTSTETGQKIARERLAQWVSKFFYLPHDFPWTMDALVRRVNPSFFVLVETDIWPNLLSSLGRHGVLSVLVNGRLSEKSFSRFLRFKAFSGAILRCFDLLFAQSSQDKMRYEALGVPADRVHAVGNLKFDAALMQLSDSETASIRGAAGIDDGRQIWIAGSTHEGEEAVLLQAHLALRVHRPDLLLIIAPRNIQRAREVEALCTQYGLSVASRSAHEPAAGKAVYLLDTLGELSRFYAVADVAFIGGSLVPFGGHNPLEAVAQEKFALWGPHLFNFREIEASLMEAECGQRVSSGEELQRILNERLGSRDLRKKARDCARHFLASHPGPSEEIARILLKRRV